MNLQKMRKQHYRNMPDNVERDFDPLDENFNTDYNAWCYDFLRRMKAKHGDNLVKIGIFQSHLEFGHMVRVQLSAVVD